MDRNARSHHRQTLGGVQSRARRAQAVDYFNILTVNFRRIGAISFSA